MTRTVTKINRDWKMKVYGYINGVRVNHLIGVSGLIGYVGEELAEKFVERAYRSKQDVCHCKLRRGIKISFYTY